MKLVIFGLTISSSWGNGHATLWRGLCNALIKAGHEVVFFERDVPYYAQHRDLWEIGSRANPATDGRGRGKLILYAEWAVVQTQAARHLSDADAAIVTSYCPDGVPASELVVSSRCAVRAFYDLDTPVTLRHLRSGAGVEYLPPRGLADFDLVLSYTGGGALDALRTELGAKRVAPLYGSVDPEVHHPVQAVDSYRADMSYLGTYAEDRQKALEALLVEPARQLSARRFVIGGAQYPEGFPWTDNIFFVRHLPPAEHPAFFCSSRLTLNVTRAAMAEMGHCPSGRLFEAAACGVPILSDWWEGLDAFFTPGTEILVGRSTEEAISALECSEAELKQVAKAARERALLEHTAARRAEELIQALESARQPCREAIFEELGVGASLRAPAP